MLFLFLKCPIDSKSWTKDLHLQDGPDKEWPQVSLGTNVGMQVILPGEINLDPKHHSFNSGNMLLQQANN